MQPIWKRYFYKIKSSIQNSFEIQLLSNRNLFLQLSVYYQREVAGFEQISLDFLIDDLDLITPEGEPSGIVSNDELFSTMVELEFQFMTDDELDVSVFTLFMTSFVVRNEWVDHTIWTNPSCLEDGIYCKIQRK